ncbi:MAG: Unknown protein [uncultured Sulfurovum sp.]|uniref:Uncharacterized protein n=1 Tax=uncultured Sulfurovum sp. TaxID=269237 RepID=A0A6S6T1Z7_9BACT|nr:MAG: Unknown protein [uncultured Sulfurovum sp.]
MNKKITFVILFLLTCVTLHGNDRLSTLNSSSYTSIAQKDCITLDSDNVGSIQECESFEGIGVKVIEGDIRQSIILTRNEHEYDLDFWTTVSSAFSSLGLKIEWRHQLGKPQNLKGMIVRFEASDNHEKAEKSTSYLVVSKINHEEICVVAKILPQKNQNEIARTILDTNDEIPCLKKLQYKK